MENGKTNLCKICIHHWENSPCTMADRPRWTEDGCSEFMGGDICGLDVLKVYRQAHDAGCKKVLKEIRNRTMVAIYHPGEIDYDKLTCDVHYFEGSTTLCGRNLSGKWWIDYEDLLMDLPRCKKCEKAKENDKCLEKVLGTQAT